MKQATEAQPHVGWNEGARFRGWGARARAPAREERE